MGGLGETERDGGGKGGGGLLLARTCCLGTLSLGGCLGPVGGGGCVFVCGHRDKVALCKRLVRRQSFCLRAPPMLRQGRMTHKHTQSALEQVQGGKHTGPYPHTHTGRIQSAMRGLITAGQGVEGQQ